MTDDAGMKSALKAWLRWATTSPTMADLDSAHRLICPEPYIPPRDITPDMYVNPFRINGYPFGPNNQKYLESHTMGRLSEENAAWIRENFISDPEEHKRRTKEMGLREYWR